MENLGTGGLMLYNLLLTTVIVASLVLIYELIYYLRIQRKEGRR